MNRIFKLQGGRPIAPKQRFVDMTATALSAGYAVPLKIEATLVRNYFVPTNPDDNGVGLVSSLLDDFYSALAEEIPGIRVSHGSWLSVYCEFVAQRRNRILPEILHLRYLIGPCTSNCPSITISCERPPRADEQVPF